MSNDYSKIEDLTPEQAEQKRLDCISAMGEGIAGYKDKMKLEHIASDPTAVAKCKAKIARFKRIKNQMTAQ